MEIYKFNKTFQERLVEYQQILNIHKTQEAIPVSQIRLEWCCYLEFCIQPSGWQALWKIPRLTCILYGIPSSTTVLVEVYSINFPELSALVTAESTSNETVIKMIIAAEFQIPLIELYPTIKQKSIAADVKGIAVCIDQLRFFYNCILWPWDIDIKTTKEYRCGKLDYCYLESRMRLLFYMRKKIVSRQTFTITDTFLQEAKELQIIIARIMDLIRAGEAELSETNLMLSRYKHRLKQIVTQMAILDSLSWKTIFIIYNDLYLNITKKISDNINNQKTYCFVSEHSNTIQELQKVFDKIQILLPKDALVEIHENVQGALCKSNEGDTILLPNAMHVLHEPCKLMTERTIKGISDLDVPNSSDTRTVPTVESSVTGAVFEYFGTEFHFENIRINVQNLQAGIVAKRGNMKIVNCDIRTTNSKVTDSFGIVILPGAKVTIENTRFHGFGIAVVVHPRGEVIMTECKFETCYDAIHFVDDTLLTLSKCKFHNISNFAIRMETTKYLLSLAPEYGNEILLCDMFEICIRECEFLNTPAAMVAIQPRGIVCILNANTENEILPLSSIIMNCHDC